MLVFQLISGRRSVFSHFLELPDGVVNHATKVDPEAVLQVSITLGLFEMLQEELKIFLLEIVIINFLDPLKIELLAFVIHVLFKFNHLFLWLLVIILELDFVTEPF